MDKFDWTLPTDPRAWKTHVEKQADEIERLEYEVDVQCSSEHVEMLCKRIEQLEAFMHKFTEGGFEDSYAANMAALQALGGDKCEHEWLHNRAPLTNKPDKCVLCGVPREQALGGDDD